MKNTSQLDNSVAMAADAGRARTGTVSPPSLPGYKAPKNVPNENYPGVMAPSPDRTGIDSERHPRKRSVPSVYNPTQSAATHLTPQTLPVASGLRGSKVSEGVALSRTLENAMEPDEQGSITVVVMGPTGTGKSTFINLLTNDDRIQIGHDPESETFDIQTSDYIDPRTDRRITLVDMPGFDDSRDGVPDTDILEKMIRFLEPESGEARQLNGIIYMHRISDPRVGGAARKNLRMFQALCGDGNLDHVRIVTTNWSRVSEQQGSERQDALEQGAFKALMDAGAQSRRHANTIESAQQIMSDFITLSPVTMLIQQELRDGKTLADTSAGIILTAEMRELQQKHAKELADLRREMNEAAEANDSALRAELEQERMAIEEQMARSEVDQKRLDRTLEQARADLAVEQKLLAESRARIEQEAATLQAQQAETEKEAKQLHEKIRASQAQRQELERMEQEALDSQDLARKLAEERRARKKDAEARRQEYERARNERSTQETVKELGEQVKALERRCQELEKSEQEAIDHNRRLREQLARAREKDELIQERNKQLRRGEEELRQRQLHLRQEQAEIERKRMDIHRRSQQGGFGFVHNMGKVVFQCASVGGDAAGMMGAVIGGAVGIMIAPGVTAVNVIRGRT